MARHQTLNLAFPWFESKRPSHFLDVAQFGRALDLGSSGQRFKSFHSDHADLAQLVVQLTCNQQVTGSIPVVGTSLDFQGFASVIHIQAASKNNRVVEVR